jgi:hypothetical protein
MRRGGRFERRHTKKREMITREEEDIISPRIDFVSHSTPTATRILPYGWVGGFLGGGLLASRR